MAVAIITNLFRVHTPATRLRSSNLCSLRRSTRRYRRASFAYSLAFLDTKSIDPVKVDKEANRIRNLLACPICYDSLTWTGDPAFSVDSTPGSCLQCSTCMKTFVGNEAYIDLTTANGAKSYGEPMPASTELFRVPLVSFLYERGWRQAFSVWGGFPGPEKEFELMKDFLRPVMGGNIIDASCASGLFSRLFAKSGLFSSVVALDYSENMLQQCYEFIKQEENFPKENFILMRADISRLPFVSSSVDAVHAGAAIHCWPSPSAAVAEISRVLRPGGVFVATTYILDGPFSFFPFLRELRQSCTSFYLHALQLACDLDMDVNHKTLKQVSGSCISLSERELEDLCRGCGLVRFSCIRNGLFVMFSAAKPS
ncbi:uncharacterized methyltransferase At1g78140, chloroplastic-like isoform X2 [Prosopis cineraria]|uniref:uncharacterized methyltransferase At1g78140, chloroplastic-like isoform X2 n=1 Tax=Prosopis cineraria TaxID=364024 RepID=UPI0024107AF5|nr:uncharacterized methyltransferase At1g78140, chloroplastic-like isoform X2 [Prosopis cineraria]